MHSPGPRQRARRPIKSTRRRNPTAGGCSRSRKWGCGGFLLLDTTRLVGVLLLLLLSPTTVHRPSAAGVGVWGFSSSSSNRPSRRTPTTTPTIVRQQQASSSSNADAATIRVAIIGGGVAGLSCADALTRNSNNHNSNNNNKDDPSCWDVTVFDTGRLRPGGRCSSRQVGDKPSNKQQQEYPILNQYRYDHGAQILALPYYSQQCAGGEAASIDCYYQDFIEQVTQWEKDGIVTPFPPNSIYNIQSPQNMQVLNGLEGNSNATSTKYYYGTRGMGSIPQAMLQQNGGRFKLQQDVWISPSNGVQYRPQSQQWRVQVAPQVWETFDRLVIAHNGKCADRIMSATPARELHSLLRVNFAPTVNNNNNNNNNRRMTLNSLYSLTFAGRRRDSTVLSQHLPEAFVAGYIRNHPSLRFLTCQTRKYPNNNNNNNNRRMTLNSLYSLTFAGRRRDSTVLSQHLPEAFVAGYIRNHPSLRFLTCQTRKYPNNNNKDNTEDMELWTVLSSPAFAQRHKAPQEFLPPDTVAHVTRELLQAVHEAVTGHNNRGEDHHHRSGVWLGDWEILDSRLQLWGAAVPLNVWHPTTTADEVGREKNTASVPPAGFLYDAAFGVGACGDWLVEPSLAGAWTSGQRLAQYMRLSSSPPVSHGLSVGGRFVKSDATAHVGIGALPTTGSSTSTTAHPSGGRNNNNNNSASQKKPPRRRPFQRRKVATTAA